jgi:hypothetical protein
MKRSLYVSLFLVTSLIGRDNPFFAIDESKIQKVTSNVPDTKPSLGTISYSLPDQARILQEISFTVQNLDGSIETHKMKVDQSIDWHKALVVSQSKGASIPQNIKTQNKSSSADFGFIHINTEGKRLTLRYSDPFMHHFVLSDPNRIVIDFKKNALFDTVQKQLNAAPYLSANLANHGKFARITITLDGRYEYIFNNKGSSISIVCK